MEQLTSAQQSHLDLLNTNTKAMGFGAIIAEMIENINESGKTGTPVNAVNASEVLTVSGVVIEGETVTIDNPAVAGSDVYEFTAGSDAGAGNIEVDIEDDTTKASGTLTMDTQPTSGDTVTIGNKVFTFVPAGTATADGEVSIGADLAGAQAALVAAINGTDGINDAHTQVTAAAFAADDCVITAIVGGTAANAYATTETFTAVTNVFAAATLGSGADCIAADAITALAAAITASDTQGVAGADGAGDTLDVTADVAGVLGNAIAVSETMANGAFGDAVMSGGIDGTVGEINDVLIDATNVYFCIADENAISGKSWRKIPLQAL
jgi:hypothetical protein